VTPCKNCRRWQAFGVQQPRFLAGRVLLALTMTRRTRRWMDLSRLAVAQTPFERMVIRMSPS
jgi:hypothetical protein